MPGVRPQIIGLKLLLISFLTTYLTPYHKYVCYRSSVTSHHRIFPLDRQLDIENIVAEAANMFLNIGHY